MVDRGRVNRLVQLIEEGLAGQAPKRTPLRVVTAPSTAPPQRFDSITRESHLQRIRYLARAYDLHWLVQQATFDTLGLDTLNDDELLALHADLDLALDCISEGTAFEEVGLVRKLSRR